MAKMIKSIGIKDINPIIIPIFQLPESELLDLCVMLRSFLGAG